MKRAAWPRKSPPGYAHAREIRTNQPPAIVEYAQVAIKKIVKSTTKMAKPGDFGTTVAHPKTEALRSEQYRRLTAQMPCKSCGIQGYGQAAHANTGKGMGLKTDDRTCFCLCADRPGTQGCHSRLDQGAMFNKEDRQRIELMWAAQTRRQIEAMGAWPKNLPKMAERPVDIA